MDIADAQLAINFSASARRNKFTKKWRL